jgi:hypothetical protein
MFCRAAKGAKRRGRHIASIGNGEQGKNPLLLALKAKAVIFHFGKQGPCPEEQPLLRHGHLLVKVARGRAGARQSRSFRIKISHKDKSSRV